MSRPKGDIPISFVGSIRFEPFERSLHSALSPSRISLLRFKSRDGITWPRSMPVRSEAKLSAEFTRRAQTFAGIACDALESGVQHAFFANAAVSIELLGKAVLCQVSPALISDGDFESLLYLLDREEATADSLERVRTISGSETIGRCARLIPELAPLKERLLAIAESRNGSVHFVGESPPFLDAHAAAFLGFVELACKRLEMQTDTIIRSTNSLGRLEARRSAAQSTVGKRLALEVARARARFRKNYKRASRGNLVKLRHRLVPPTITAGDEETEERCPACGQQGSLYCLREGHRIEDGGTGFYSLLPVVFSCGYCRLDLDDADELQLAGLPTKIDVTELPSGETWYYHK